MYKKIILIFIFISAMGIQLKAQVNETNNPISFKRNIIHFNMSDVIFKRIGFDFEHVIGSEGIMSINIPVSVSFGDPDVMYQSLYYTQVQIFPMRFLVDFSDWYAGLGINFYPKGQGGFKMNFGAEMRVGAAHRYPEIYYQDDYVDCIQVYDEEGNSCIQPTYKEQSFFQTSFLANIGMAYSPFEEFIVSLKLNAGITTSVDNTVAPIFIPTLRMGLKF